MENKRSKNDEVSIRVWKVVETEAREVRLVKAKGERRKGEKEKRRKGEKEKKMRRKRTEKEKEGK